MVTIYTTAINRNKGHLEQLFHHEEAHNRSQRLLTLDSSCVTMATLPNQTNQNKDMIKSSQVRRNSSTMLSQRPNTTKIITNREHYETVVMYKREWELLKTYGK